MAQHSFLQLLLASAFLWTPAHADVFGNTKTAVKIIPVGHIRSLPCYQALAEFAQKSIEQKHPNLVPFSSLGFPAALEDLALQAGSGLNSARIFRLMMAWLWSHRDEHSPILQETMDAYSALKKRNGLAICMLPNICKDGEALGTPKAWLYSLRNGFDFDVHGHANDESNFKKDPLIEELLESNPGLQFPKMMLFLQTPFEVRSQLMVYTAVAQTIIAARSSKDLEYLTSWANRNVERLRSGNEKDVDWLFAKYGKLVKGRPSIDLSFANVFSKAHAQSAVAAAFAFLQKRDAQDIKEEFEQNLWDLLHSDSTLKQFMDEEIPQPSEIFTRVEEWFELLQLAAAPEQIGQK